MTSITFPTTSTPTRPYYVAFPTAHIETAQHSDGRWMWGISFDTATCGEGCAPLAKWGRFAATEAAAIDAGIQEMRERIASRANPNDTQLRKLKAWLDKIEQPRQLQLWS